MSVILNMWGEDHALQFVKQNYFNGNLTPTESLQIMYARRSRNAV